MMRFLLATTLILGIAPTASAQGHNSGNQRQSGYQPPYAERCINEPHVRGHGACQFHSQSIPNFYGYVAPPVGEY
jgi:hypothetical protein